jgi:hypothetical protein
MKKQIFDGRYEIYEDGQVKSLLQHKVIRPVVMNNGYAMVHLRIETGIRRQLYVHRLVAEAFIPNPINKPCVNHKDKNKLNNHVSNLEWVTHSENEIHKNSVTKGSLYATDDAGHEHGPFKSVKHAIEVLQIPGRYESIASGISHCFKENGNSYGYKWRRSTDN